MRDNYFGYNGQFRTEYVRNVKIMSLFSKTYPIFLSHSKSQFMHNYYCYLDNIQIGVMEIIIICL